MDYSYMEAQLRDEYREVFEKTELYGVISEVNTEVQDELMMNLFDLLLTAQTEGKPVEKIVGPDMEKFCKEYFQNYNWKERMKYFPVQIYRFMRAVFILELLDFFLLEENVDLLRAQSDITPYIGGFGLSLVFTMIVDVFVRPMMFRLRIKPIFYYIGILVFWAAALVICILLTDGLVFAIPMFPILVVSGTYVTLYLIIRSVWRYRRYGSIRRPRSEAKQFERSIEKESQEMLMLDIMLKRYQSKNKRLEKKGKKGLTPGEYTAQVRAEYEKVKNSWKWGIVIFAIIILAGVIPTALTSTFWDTVLFTLVLCVVETGIYYWFIFKIERDNNRARKDILDACDREGISVIEYAMRNKKKDGMQP